jgi:hypothetical protein
MKGQSIDQWISFTSYMGNQINLGPMKLLPRIAGKFRILD